MAKEKRKVIFRRIRGRLVPIRIKEGSGKRGGRLKAAPNIKQKVGKILTIGGIGLTTTGLFTSQIVFKSFGFPKIFKKRLQSTSIDLLFKGKEASAAIKEIKARKVVSLKGIKGFKKIQTESFKGSFKAANLIASKFKITGKSLIPLGLITIGAGIFATGKGNRQRARQSRALNK